MSMWIRAKSQTIYNIQNIYWFMFLHGFCCCCRCYGGGVRFSWGVWGDADAGASDDCCRFDNGSTISDDGQRTTKKWCSISLQRWKSTWVGELLLEKESDGSPSGYGCILKKKDRIFADIFDFRFLLKAHEWISIRAIVCTKNAVNRRLFNWRISTWYEYMRKCERGCDFFFVLFGCSLVRSFDCLRLGCRYKLVRFYVNVLKNSCIFYFAYRYLYIDITESVVYHTIPVPDSNP